MAKENDTALDIQRKKKTTRRRIIQIIVLLIFLVPAILLSIFWKNIIYNRIYKAIELKPNTEGYATWFNPPTTITRDYYLFNITNPLEIITDPTATTVQIKETPPYSYSLSASKKHIQWINESEAIRYSIYRTFSRHPTKFKTSAVNDTGTFVDILRAIFRTQFQTKPSQSFFYIGGMSPFYERNAIDQLEGFTSELFQLMRDKMTGPNTAKYGYIYRYNGSRSYNYTIKAGLTEKGQVLSFASENVPFSFSSSDKFSQPIYDGLTFVPMVFDKPSLNIFQADFCRPVNVKFNRVLSMFGGIHVHEYIIRLVDFDKCTNASDINTCPELPKLDISKCISSSLPEETVFLSKPHFFGADEETMKEMNIEGFTPTRDKHEALIYFEPYSGTPLRAHHRIQLNIDATIDPMRQSSYGSDLEPAGRRGVRRLLPLVWIDQEVNVDDATIRTLRMVHYAIRYGRWIIIILAIVLAAIIILLMEFFAQKAMKNERLQTKTPGRDEQLLNKQSEIN